MNTPFEEIISKLTEFLKNEVKTENVIGQPFQLGEFNCVPVIRTGLGFGGGGGIGDTPKTGKGEGGGGGLGMGIEPMGFLVTRGSEISFISTRSSKGLSSVLEKVPDLVEKFMEKKKNAETEKK